MQLDASQFCTPALRDRTLKLRNDFLAHQKEEMELKKQKLPCPKFNVPEYEIGSNPTALYTLVAILTHQGRSSDSGHYIGWVKREIGWVKYDDDKIDVCSEEEIKKLEGGGESHGAYICLYKSVVLDC